MQNRRYASKKIKLRKGEYQRQNDLYEYKWTDAQGKRHSIYSKSLSELRRREELVEKDATEGYEYNNLNSTINDYYELWKQIKSGIRKSTFSSYTRPYERYVMPTYGKTKLRNVTYSSVMLFLKSLASEKGLGISTIKKVNITLGMVLEVAVKDGVLKANPCRGAITEMSRELDKDIKHVKALTVPEQKLFEEFLRRPGRYNRWYPLFTVMMWTGMRVGEVIGLQWEDIDFENNEIHVNHSLVHYDIGKNQGSTYTMNLPKTRTSIRVVPMLPRVKEALYLEKERQENFGITCVSNIDGFTNFVFLNNNGKVYHHKKLNHQLNVITQAINEDIQENGNEYGVEVFPHIHNHMLRHTFATRMREAGADIKATSNILGHTRTSITLDIYTDASTEFKNREIGVLDKYYPEEDM